MCLRGSLPSHRVQTVVVEFLALVGLQVAADLEVRGRVLVEFEVLDSGADARASCQVFERAGRAVEPPEFVSQ